MEKPKIPHLDKVVGVPKEHIEKQQGKFEEYLTGYFSEIGGAKIENYELEKTKEDIELIQFSSNAVDNYLQKYNRNIRGIPLENIHILKEKSVEEITGGSISGGLHSTINGSVLVEKTLNRVNFSLVVFHELVHAKSFTAMQVTNGGIKENSEIIPYRVGFSVTSRDGNKIYFEDVNEAVVGLLTERFFKDYIETSDLFKDELQKMKESKTPVDLSRQREVKQGLEYINEIYKLNNDKYSFEQVMDIFIEAGINGNLFKVARLIEDTFGKGSFRALGEVTSREVK
ncbi:MAG: hypothetical protein KBB75_01975 [Candidatus Pacebacteria bacterium]|nr:hypothetical protein [Candidatus Paceibacterota bacterium]MBP9815602.1 hypothetical protein [Candidatus Levybacteria bacterium]